jgi:hypothetical protein
VDNYKAHSGEQKKVVVRKFSCPLSFSLKATGIRAKESDRMIAFFAL